jgi:hypothetical protein
MYGEIAIGDGGINEETRKVLAQPTTARAALDALKSVGTDITRGAVSNAESLARGAVSQVPGLVGDVESLGRKGINFAFGPGGVKVDEKTVAPTLIESAKSNPLTYSKGVKAQEALDIFSKTRGADFTAPLPKAKKQEVGISLGAYSKEGPAEGSFYYASPKAKYRLFRKTPYSSYPTINPYSIKTSSGYSSSYSQIRYANPAAKAVDNYASSLGKTSYDYSPIKITSTYSQQYYLPQTQKVIDIYPKNPEIPKPNYPSYYEGSSIVLPPMINLGLPNERAPNTYGKKRFRGKFFQAFTFDPLGGLSGKRRKSKKKGKKKRKR